MSTPNVSYQKEYGPPKFALLKYCFSNEEYALHATITAFNITSLQSTDCFDPWLNQEVADGSSYERVRQMTEYQPLTGTYSCSCKLGVIRCTG